MKLNRKWLLVIALVMSLAMATAGTLAYLTDSDAAANVMTLGSVKIKQHEYERVIENGEYKTTTDKTSYVLKEFTQGKPLMPATELDDYGNPYNFGAGNYDTTRVKMSQVHSHGSMDVFESKNAQDKFVTVENTGRSDAYVRTLIAFELGKLSADRFDEVIRTSSFMTDKGVWKVTDVGVVEIKGNNYFVCKYDYNGAKALGGVHENGVLPAGDTTYPSLAQVYMTAAATNEDCETIDGNLNGKYDILVLSQAVQVNGFDDAETALTAGFGEATVENVAKWFGDSGVVDTVFVSTADELKEALEEGKNVILKNDITLNEAIALDKEANINLNNHTLASKGLQFNKDVTIKNGKIESNGPTSMKPHLNVTGAKLTLDSVDVEITHYMNYYAQGNRSYAEFTGVDVVNGEAVLNNSTVKINNDTKYTWSYLYTLSMNNSTITMNGGKIEAKSKDSTLENDYVVAVSGAGNCTANLNNVSIDADSLGLTMGHLIINTTDESYTTNDIRTFTDKQGNLSGTGEVNYIN